MYIYIYSGFYSILTLNFHKLNTLIKKHSKSKDFIVNLNISIAVFIYPKDWLYI